MTSLSPSLALAGFAVFGALGATAFFGVGHPSKALFLSVRVPALSTNLGQVLMDRVFTHVADDNWTGTRFKIDNN